MISIKSYFRFYLQRIKNIYHFFKAEIANFYFDYPSRKITVIGVTGTDGKTTTSLLIYHILSQLGQKTSVLTTNFAKIGTEVYDTGFHVTNPSSNTIQQYLFQAVKNADKYFVLETTSHGLDQYRVGGVKYDVSVITNITHEHLYDHLTYENYVRVKAKLILCSKLGILNKDDASFQSLRNVLQQKNQLGKIKTYSLKQDASYRIDISKKIGKTLPEFNLYNYLAAYSVCRELGFEDRDIFRAMRSFTLPEGRMEVVYDKKFTAIVDFAHTPNAIKEALKAVQTLYPKRKIIHIFGTAAFRDDSKRPLMGKESATYASTTILTEEDYRTEDPERINIQIGKGLLDEGWEYRDPSDYVGSRKTYTSIINRREAFQKALEIAKEDDVIIVTGKGHEKSLNRNGKEIHWNDKEEILKEIRNKK